MVGHNHGLPQARIVSPELFRFVDVHAMVEDDQLRPGWIGGFWADKEVPRMRVTVHKAGVEDLYQIAQ